MGQLMSRFIRPYGTCINICNSMFPRLKSRAIFIYPYRIMISENAFLFSFVPKGHMTITRQFIAGKR